MTLRRRSVVGVLVFSSTTMLWSAPLLCVLVEGRGIGGGVLSASRGLWRGERRMAAFEFPSLLTDGKRSLEEFTSSLLGGRSGGSRAMVAPNVAKTKAQLLQAVSFTQNGKTASKEKQIEVLQLVETLEREAPTPEDILQGNEALQKLDGTWFLQYTSPSEIGGRDQFPNAWKPKAATEGSIDTSPYAIGGTIQASGIPVSTSNRVVKQIFDLSESTVTNEVNLDNGIVVRVGGTFAPSDSVARRALVSFKQARFSFLGGKLQVALDFVFAIRTILTGSNVNGWLETTFLDDDIRIGRGNRGTMFVLTRDYDAVKP